MIFGNTRLSPLLMRASSISSRICLRYGLMSAVSLGGLLPGAWFGLLAVCIVMSDEGTSTGDEYTGLIFSKGRKLFYNRKRDSIYTVARVTSPIHKVAREYTLSMVLISSPENLLITQK